MKRLNWLLIVVVCVSLVLNIVLGIALNRQKIQSDFVQKVLDRSFRADFSRLAEQLCTKCPEDETGHALWVKEVEYLALQCWDNFYLTSYSESQELLGVIMLLHSRAFDWERYPPGLISHELAVDLLEVAYRLTDDEVLLTEVYEGLKRTSQP